MLKLLKKELAQHNEKYVDRKKESGKCDSSKPMTKLSEHMLDQIGAGMVEGFAKVSFNKSF